MKEERFAYDPADRESIVREHNQRIEDQLEQDRRVSGPTFAEGQARLARVLDNLTELAKRSVA